MLRRCIAGFLGALFIGLLPLSASAASLPPEKLETLRQYVFDLINGSRGEAGLPPVARNDAITRVSQAHSEDAATHFDALSPETREQSYIAHTSSGGRSLSSRFRDAKVDPGLRFAENVGYWIRSPYGALMEASHLGLRMIHTGMMAEVPPNDGHKQTLLGDFTDVGIGLALFDTPGAETNAIFLVTDFVQYGPEGEAGAEETFRPAVTEPPTRSLPRNPPPSHGGPFLDVKPTDPSADAIMAMKERKIIQGYPDGTFQPRRTVSRAELLKMLMDTIGLSPIGKEFDRCFTDLLNEWFAPYVCIAKREGWVQGYSDRTFRPANPVSRAEAVTLLARILKLPTDVPTTTLPYRDVPEDSWFALPVRSAMKEGLLPFDGGKFSPALGMRRGEVAEMLYRAIRK